MPKVKFISNRPWLNQKSASVPSPASKSIPEWYKNASRYYADDSGNFSIMPDGGKMPTWKSCPAIYDVLITGYVFKTPCDIEFFLDESGEVSAKVLDNQYQDFLQPREPMPQFQSPVGYQKRHWAWWIDWATELPKGYSAIYTHPMDRFDLPFLSTSGIVDNDKVNLPGTMPFFILDGWTGVLPAGTPYSQMIPFKREDWSSEVIVENPLVLYDKNMENSIKYRKPNGGVYQRDVWERRKYS